MSLLGAGSKLGRFRITSVLGQGAMGVVYLADDPEIERPVAIKTVRPEAGGGATSQELETRFLKEARLAGRLQHPNIVTVYDVGRDRDVCFIAMEYVEGHPLTYFLGAVDELPLAVRVGVIRQVAEALGHAHERGVLHRDIKPGNILVTKDGRAKVTDFGIGKFTTAGTSDLTRTGQIVGSPAYLSPEQVKGEKLDGRSDLFSLGIVLYELLTGARPFPGESITTLVYQILHTEPRDPLAWKSGLPIATREVIARILAKSPDKRPADAKEFVRELMRIEKIQRESQMTPRAAAAPPPPPASDVSSAVTQLAASGRAAPAPPPVPVPVPAAPPPPAARRSGMPIILAALAVLIAGSFFLLRGRREEAAAPPVVATPGLVAASEPTAPPVTEVPTPEPTAEPAPTPATPEPAAAAPPPAVPTRPRPTRRPNLSPAPSPAAAAPEEKIARAEPSGVAPASAFAPPSHVDKTFATRRGVRFTSSPDQARLYLDGRYVGIADDWDNRGGGRELEPGKAGSHYVRMELPGYKPLIFEIDVTSDASKDSISIDEEMERFDRMAYPKLPAPADRTTGAVEFAVDPTGATVSEGDRALGPVSAYGPGSPLVLKGPTVHDLVLSAPGYKSKLVRILVAGNAGKDRAVVKETLKKE